MSKYDIKTDWIDPDEIPELTDEWFDMATLKYGDTIIRRGRPKLAEGEHKKQVAIRLSPKVLEHFRATGKGWQARINETLERAITE